MRVQIFLQKRKIYYKKYSKRLSILKKCDIITTYNFDYRKEELWEVKIKTMKLKE